MRLNKKDREVLTEAERQWVEGSGGGWYMEGLLQSDPYSIPDLSTPHGRILCHTLGRRGMSLLKRTEKKCTTLQARIDKLFEEFQKTEERHMREFVLLLWDKLPHYERQGLAHYLVTRRTCGKLFGLELLERLRQERIQYHRQRGDHKRANKLRRKYKYKPISMLGMLRRLQAREQEG